MAFKIITLRSAKIDVENAVEWYEEQKPSLGSKFYDEFLVCLYKLTESPQHYGYAYKNFRQLVLPTFPYKIIYFITVNEVIVHAVFHVRQNPKELIKRLK
jgi:plasmid stabilization system protein ParE